MQHRPDPLLFVLFHRGISKTVVVATSVSFHQVSMAQVLRLVHRLDTFRPCLLLLANGHRDLCHVLLTGH